MIRRERDAELINRISNMEGVRSGVCYHERMMDWSPVFEPATGIVILSNGDDAVGVFEMTGEREWQIHTVFAPTCRGKKALQVAREMLDWMAKWGDAFWGATPDSNRAAKWFNRQLGFKSVGHDVYEAEGPVEMFRLELN